MVYKNCDAHVPILPQDPCNDDKVLLNSVDGLIDIVRGHMDKQAFHEALREVWNIIAQANRYVGTVAPWVLEKLTKSAWRRFSCGAQFDK